MTSLGPENGRRSKFATWSSDISAAQGNWLYFHWKVVLLPPRIAEYVVVHEISHLHERLHTPEFWQRVERTMPDYERRKKWLVGTGNGCGRPLTVSFDVQTRFLASRPETRRSRRSGEVQADATMTIEARVVPEHDRIEALPRHFGRHMLTVERRIYDFMAQFAGKYAGGCWHFFELDNGGFYMSPPDDSYEIRIDSSGFREHMSADAAGITVCLFSFSELALECTPGTFAKHFDWLRDFARDHAEADVISRAID